MIAYAITDPSTLNFNNLETDIEHFSKKADMIVYRDKATLNYASNAKLFIDETKKYIFSKVLLHTDHRLAYKLGADGVHLTSTQFDEIKSAKDLGLLVVISTHTLKEACDASRKGADMITLSPIFKSPNKREAKGLDFLLKVVNFIDTPIIALGGILRQEQIDDCRECGAKGFASIRYFDPLKHQEH